MHGTCNIAFVICVSIGTFLAVVPLPKALASGNVGTIMLIVWTALASLVQFANAIRWNGNIENWAPAWCDFSGYFLIVADLALAASSVSINRRLYMIVTLDPRRERKMFNMIVDLVLCLVIPWVSVSLQYVVRQYRFLIYEDIGCLSGVSHVDLAFPLVWMLPPLAGVASAVYAFLTVRAYLRVDHELALGESGMSSAWSRRVMTIGAISAMYGLIPTSIGLFALAAASPMKPWPGWRALHSTNDIIVYIPALKWQSSFIMAASLEVRRWTTVLLDFTVFVLLGSTADVKRMYWAPFRGIVERAFSVRQKGATHQQNPGEDSDDQDSSRSSPSLWCQCLVPNGIPRAERREIFSLNTTHRVDSSLEDVQLAHPIVARPSPDGTHAPCPSWKAHHEDGEPTCK